MCTHEVCLLCVKNDSILIAPCNTTPTRGRQQQQLCVCVCVLDASLLCDATHLSRPDGNGIILNPPVLYYSKELGEFHSIFSFFLIRVQGPVANCRTLGEEPGSSRVSTRCASTKRPSTSRANAWRATANITSSKKSKQLLPVHSSQYFNFVVALLGLWKKGEKK